MYSIRCFKKKKGHYKCLKMLHDAGLDMFEQDAVNLHSQTASLKLVVNTQSFHLIYLKNNKKKKEHITPYDLAMASKNPDCRNFAINLKPTLSFEDGPIQINSPSLQNINGLQALFLIVCVCVCFNRIDRYIYPLFVFCVFICFILSHIYVGEKEYIYSRFVWLQIFRLK